MPGIKIKIDASDAVREGKKAEGALNNVGKAAKTSEKDVTKFSKALGIDKEVRAMTAGLGKIGSAVVVNIAKFTALGAAMSGAFAVGFGIKSIKLASDFQETQNKFDVVFRGMTKTAEDWSATLVKSYAMSRTESKQYLSSIQDLLVPTGMARDAAGKLSNEFVKMAADLGSFNNRETVDVIMDIQSALQGSSETMAKYGINVKEAKVSAEVFRLGLAKEKDEITDAHKAMAIYNIMMREGGDAVGDMARSQGTYAQELKKFKSNVNDLATVVGVQLLPPVTELVGKTNDWFIENEDLINQKVPEYVDAITSAFAGMPEKIESTITSVGDLKEELAWFVDNWEIIAGILLGSKFGPWGAAAGAGFGLFIDQKKDIEATFTAQEKLNAATDKYNSLAYSHELDLPFAATAEVVNAARLEVERLQKKLADTNLSGWKSIAPDEADIKNFQVFGDVVELGVKKAGTATTATTALTKEQEAAAKVAQKHAEKIADVIDNLKWETEMLSLSEDEQYRMNALKSAGIGINDKMAASVLAVADAYLVAKKNAESWKPFLDFMSDDQINETSIQFHEGSAEAQEKNLQSMVDYWPEIAEASSDSAKKSDEAWEEAAKNIQNAWAGLFSKIFRGEITGANDVLKELMYTMSDNAAQNFAAQFKNIDWNKALGGVDNDLGKFFTNILKDFNLTAGQAVNSLAAVIATAYSAVGMAKKDAALSGAMTGASVGGQSGNGYAAAAGLVIGGAAGYMLGNNEPSYGERLSDAIEKLIETLQANNVLLADQILNTNELTLAQEKMTRSIFSTKMEGVNATLAGAFKIPEGMEKRSHSSSIYQGVLADFAGTFMDELAGLGTAGSLNPTLRDEGYTATKYSKADTSKIISDLMGEIGVPDFIMLMKQASDDSGAIIRKLVETGQITAEIPERVLKYFSSGSSDAKRNEKVAGAIFEVMLNGVMELSVGIGKMNDASVAFAKTWADKDISAFNKDMQDWQDTMNVFAGDDMVNYLAEIQAAKDALEATSQEDLDKMDVSQMADHIKNIAALGQVIDDTATKIEDAEKTRLVIEQYYSDQRDDIMAGMAMEMDLATGKYSKMEQAYMSIMDKAEAYRLELIDNGMASYEEAGNAARDYAVATKTATKNAQMAATALAYNNNTTQKNIDLLTLLGKTDEAEAAIKKQTLDTRIAEVQSLKDIYGANTELFQTNLDLAEASWAADDALSSATTRLAKMAEAMEGMWGEDSILEAKQAWITVLESLGETVTPKFFLDSIGLGTDSGLEHLLSATTSDEVHADLTELITLYRTDVIKQDDFNAILGKINDNASDIAQSTEDMAAAMEEASKVNTQAGEWLRETLASYQDNSSGVDAEIKSVTDVMEDFRDQLEATGHTVSEVWAAGGKIENEIVSLIHDKWLADLKEETAAPKSGYAELADKRDELLKNYADNSIDIHALQSYAVDIQNEQARLMAEAQQMIADHPEQTANDPGWPQFVIDSFQQSIDYWGDELKTVNDKIAYATETSATIADWYARESLALDRENLNSIRHTLYNITGDTDILWQQFLDLQEDWMKVDAQDYGAQYDILNEQNNILETIRDIQKEQLQTAIDNYTTLEDVKLSLQGGSLAPGQSLEFFQKRYAQLFDKAQSGETADVNAFSGFIDQYADFIKAYGTESYKDFAQQAIADLTAVQDGITDGATLDDLNAQLEALNSADSPIVSELVRIADILAGMTGSGSLSDALAFDETAYLNRYPDVATAVAADGYNSGYEHWQKYGQDEGRIPGFASGGTFIAGENGMEAITIRPGSSASISNNRETVKMIAEAVAKAIGGMTGGEVVVTVNLDGKAIDPRMVKVLKTNPDAQDQIRRIAKAA